MPYTSLSICAVTCHPVVVGITGPGKVVKEPGTPEQIAAALAAANPWLGLLTGGVGLLVILWLMMFKPF